MHNTCDIKYFDNVNILNGTSCCQKYTREGKYVKFLFTVQNRAMFLKVGVFLYFLDLLTKCSGVCQPPCSVTGWGSWSSCRANGTQTRDKLYCCPKGITTLDACLKNCSIAPESPAVQSCVYTNSSILTTQAGIIVTHASKYILRGLSKRRWILTCTCT